MGRKLIFPLVAVLLLTPWPVAYAFSNYPDDPGVQIEAATDNLTIWTAYGDAIGGVSTPSDIFYLNATNYELDMLVTLYLTNAFELSHFYRYLILKIGVYFQDGTGEWRKATSNTGEILPDTYITMRNGDVSFRLRGQAYYKLTIESGSFYCYPNGGAISPAFYLTLQ